MTILAVFAAVYPILPSNSKPFSELGTLGPDRKIGGYPNSVTASQPFLLYGYVGNHAGVTNYYEVLVKLGNRTTVISISTYANVPTIASHPLMLADNQTSIFAMKLSVGEAGTNVRLIFELWSFNVTTSQFGYAGLWNQLWVNVTAR